VTQDEDEIHKGEKSNVRTLGRVTTLGASVLIAIGAALLILLIYSSEPKAEREAATRETAMLVDVMTVSRGTYAPKISGLGTTTAAQDISLMPRVPGRIVGVSANFIPGGFVSAGETLATLDPTDYRNAVARQESAVEQAESELAVERGRGDVARRDYEILGQGMDDKNPALALREPQLEAAQAALKSAQASLEQAKQDLARTKVTAPFHAQVLTRNANVGSEVNTGTTLARLVGVDEYHVIVTVPLAKLNQIVFPYAGNEASAVRLRDRAAWHDGAYRQGKVLSLIGAIDGETRLARVLVSVQDPLALQMPEGTPILLVGSILYAEIDGRTVEDVVRIERAHLRQGDTVWVMHDGKLDIRNVAVAFSDTEHVYISAGLDDGDVIVTSTLATVAQGAPLRTEAIPSSNDS